ncbi:hypothetical protein NNC19_17095 [Clostridium sp. SHJSY1]|uniref:hypothetical protein n=1 Tax=Clostridium sp. SHJSY1 TaxID=2942483 RepID=UPI002874E997|nr:hypothetical protein [Clostridium sp. SHJSY1]MDS0527410.1 hypothetical protein [Clostridium sp. SHJSY1]
MEYVIMLSVLMRAHPIISMLAMIFIGFAGAVLAAVTNRRKLSHFVIILFPLYMINLFAGHFLTNALLENYGEKGEGIVVSSNETSDLYNDQPVWRYDVMLKSGNEEPISTYFLTSDFNIIHKESFNEYRYPSKGIRFNVWYLKKYPKAFVIIANDDSEYAKSFHQDN